MAADRVLPVVLTVMLAGCAAPGSPLLQGGAGAPVQAAVNEATPTGVEAESGADLPPAVLEALNAAYVPETALSVLVLNADGSVRLAHRVDEARQVGSLIKLVTTLAALDKLGPDYRFHTDLLADPLPGKGGRWSLAFRGGGDPELRSEDLRHMLRTAEAQGMHKVASPVRQDISRFAAQAEPTSGIRIDAGRVSATLPSALTVDFAAVEVLLPESGQGEALADPPLPLLTMHPKAAEIGACPNDWLESLGLEPVVTHRKKGDAESHALGLRGTWPATCPEGVLRRSPLSPEKHFDWVLQQTWQSLGHAGPLRGELGPAPSFARIAVRHESRPLAELVRDTNKFSNNQMARILFLDLAAEDGALPAAAEDANQIVQRWLSGHGMVFPEMALENGAGLSHLERLTARHVGELMKYALTSDVAPEFQASLPIPGGSGTLQKRFVDLPLAGRLRLKTGAIEGVRALAGYALDGHGGSSIVVCIINDALAENTSAAQEALLRWVLVTESATKSGQ